MAEPIACSLSPADQAARKGDIGRIAREALRSRDAVPGGARLTFSGDDTTERRLRELIAAEAECCSFLRFDLARNGDMLTLDVTGPADAQPIIAALFVP